MDFEKADLSAVSTTAGPACALCKTGLVGEYFQAGAAALCPSCAQVVRQGPAKSGGFVRAMKATAFGFAFGLVGALFYAAVLYGAHIQAALITIGIGWLVGRGVMVGCEHRGGVGYQILAAVMTYLLCTEALAPSIYSGLMTGADQPNAALAWILSIALAPAAPFLGDFDPLGLLILGFGVWQGWKSPRAVDVVVSGPFQIAPASAYAAPNAPAPIESVEAPAGDVADEAVANVAPASLQES